MTVVNDISFLNILGEEISKTNLVQRMIDYYSEKLEVGETRVTDFNEGSEIRNLLEAIAVDIYALMEDQYELSRIGFISTSYGEWLDLHGENPLLDCPRNLGSEAVGLVTFTIPNVLTSDFVIPEGTLVANEDGLEFATDNEAYIVAGETSVEVFATCLTVGSDGNVKANTITIIDDTLLNNVTVNNADNFAGGTDYEEDDEYRERLLETNRKAGFGSMPYYINLATSINGVHDVLLVDYEGYTKKVIVNGYEKPVDDEILMHVLTEFTDTNNIVVKHKFIVDKPVYNIVDLAVNLDVETLIEEETILELLQCFFNGGTTSDYLEFNGLNIGENLTKRELYSALEELDYIVDVEVLIDNVEIRTVEIDEDKVFKLGEVVINQTEV